jgi:hypothetical protein
MLLNCDRVSIARTRGRKTVIEAISGQDRVNRRANLVRAMSALASEVIPSGETVVFGGRSDDLPPQVKEPLVEFIAESGSRMVMLVPLHAAQQHDQTPDDERGLQGKEQRERPWSCLILEQVADAELRPELEQQAHALSDHVAAALTNARDHQRVFLLSFWKMLGRGCEWFYGRKLLKALGAASLVAGIVAALMLIRREYRVEGDGRLLPVLQREIFAPWDGVVVDVLVADGQRMKEGTLLLRIRDDNLDSQLADVRSLAKEKQQEQLSPEARIDDAIDDSNREDAVRLQGELVEVIIQLRGHEAQERLLAKRQTDLEVRSTIAGVVATFQVEQLLINRPVRQGELLLQVMDDRGEWMLELDVDEHRTGHLLIARERLGNNNLKIDFVLATAPETNYRGHLTKVVTRPMLLPDRGSVVRVFGAIDDRDFERRIGAEVRAKIRCGEKSLGYVLFGDVIEFLYQRFWL